MEHGQDHRPSTGSEREQVGRRPAYVKVIDEAATMERVYAVFEADGQLIGMAPTRKLAFAAARQCALDPVDAH